MRFVEASSAERETIERVHPAAYVDLLERLGASGGGALDGDTIMGPRTWEAILGAAGTAIMAVDAGIEGGTAFAAQHAIDRIACRASGMQRHIVTRAGDDGIDLNPSASQVREMLHVSGVARIMHASQPLQLDG